MITEAAGAGHYELPGFAPVPRLQIVTVAEAFKLRDRAVRLPARRDGGLRRAGALDVAFTRTGDMVLEDMALLDRGLPPQLCKRAERETVSRMRFGSVPVN